MTVQYYPNGIGGTAPGDSLDLCRPLQTSGNIWYVSSLIGINAASPAGQNREKPLATLAQAITNATDNDIIVFLPGHAQTLAGTQVINKSVTLIGEGTTSGLPAVSFTMNNGFAAMFNVTADAVELRNLYFPPNAQANAADKMLWTGAGGQVRGCHFACGATDLNAALSVGSSRMSIESTTFLSTATLRTAQPGLAIRGTVAAAITGFTIKNTVVSAGTVGFSNYAAIDLSLVTFASQVDIEGLSLLLGADMNLGDGIVTGRVNVQLSTGGSRVAWS